MTKKTPVDPEALNEVMWQFAGPAVVGVANRLGLLTSLAAAPASAAEVAAELGLDPLATGKIIRALCALGIVEPSGQGYAVTPPLADSFAAGPENLGPYVDHLFYLNRQWADNLADWVRGQSPPRTPMTPEAARKFSQAMVAMGSQVARRVAASLPLAGVKRILDVGGGYGHYAQALCRRDADIRATVLDRPLVAEQGRADLAGSELAARIDFVGDDYLTADYGEGYDLVLLANVLHQELADKAASIVARAAAATSAGGRVVVVDFAIDDEQREHFMGTMFAINMRSFGDTYTETTIRTWLEAAGLSEVTRTDLTSLRWLISGSKPD